jgi:Phospholipase/Carboxylesterase
MRADSMQLAARKRRRSAQKFVSFAADGRASARCLQQHFRAPNLSFPLLQRWVADSSSIHAGSAAILWTAWHHCKQQLAEDGSVQNLQRPITVNMGMRMTGWFDIASLDEISQREDVQGLKDSMQQVEQLVREEQSQGVDK